MDHKRRIGIYGGTFDPVHLGHLDVARNVLQLFELDELLLVPALQAPHKLSRPVTSHFHRYAMLVLATQDDPQLHVSAFELEAGDRRYTVETVVHFQAQFGEAAQLFFIMGADSWSEITTWHQWQRLLSIANHVVVTRPGFDIEEGTVPESLRPRLVDLRGGKSPDLANAGEKGVVFITDTVFNDVSATHIRVAAADLSLTELRRLVPEPVAQYVKKYGLYRDSNEA